MALSRFPVIRSTFDFEALAVRISRARGRFSLAYDPGCCRW
jgi:hypothetical protein